MNDLRKAAEMALEALEDIWGCLPTKKAWPQDQVDEAIQALRQALAHEALDEMVAENQMLGLYDTHTCKTHPDAPHGFDRNVSHNLGRYVCECEFWEPVDAVNMTPERVDETAKGKHEPFIYIREDTEMPFGGFEHCGKHDPGAFPVYLAPPKRDSSSWVGLTDEEIYDYADKFLYQHGSNYGIKSFGKAIEAKLKEKNGG